MVSTETSGLISSVTGAKLLMVTPRYFRKLSTDGWIPKSGRDSYSLVGAVQGFLKFRDDVDRRSSKSAAASQVQGEKVRKLPRENEVAEARLMETSESLANFAEVFGALKAALDGLPARCSRDLDQRKKIQGELDDILHRCADSFEKLAAGGDEPRKARAK
jgi:hypothetical protein